MAMYFRALIYRLQEIISRVSGEYERKEAVEILNTLIKLYDKRPPK